MSEKVFAEGIYFNPKHENAPEFVLGSLSINRNKLIPWLENQKENKAGYVKISILLSKSSGKPYCELDTWEPNQQAAPKPQTQVFAPSFWLARIRLAFSSTSSASRWPLR